MFQEKLQHLKSLLHQTSQHLFDGGMCIQQAMEECFSSRLSQNSDPRGSSIGFMTSDEDHSPIRSRKRYTQKHATIINFRHVVACPSTEIGILMKNMLLHMHHINHDYRMTKFELNTLPYSFYYRNQPLNCYKYCINLNFTHRW